MFVSPEVSNAFYAIEKWFDLLQRRGLGPLLCYVMGLNER